MSNARGALLTRRGLLLAAAAAGGTACGPRDDAPEGIATAWVGARDARGHRLRDPRPPLPEPAVQRRAGVLIVGAGVAGLAAARAFARAGVDDVHVLELEDTAGGNSRGHRLAGMACPMGAHYLPLPAPQSHEVSEWLHEIGLLRSELGRTVADERHLCHSPQERLFIDGAWAEGLLPPADAGSRTQRQYAHLAQLVRRLSQPRPGGVPFALPAHRARWNAELAELDRAPFDHWLAAHGLDDARLRWYLDYCCRDDYGAGSGTVSAWAGVHYFASRHGFGAPGEGGAGREGVFTWPEGNAWLVQRLVAPLGERVHGGRTVLRVSESRHGVQVLAWDETGARAEAWSAPMVVLALPLFVALSVLESPPPALVQAARLLTHAPWLVANLHLDAPLLERSGAPPAWDNVVFGSRALGYVDAMHQSLRPHAGPTVLTHYSALPATEREALWRGAAPLWGERVLGDLQAVHPDIRRRVRRIDLMRWGHAMAVPRPGLHGNAARALLGALRRQRGRVRFAHADLAGYSVFEEAFTAGCEVALARPPTA